MKELNYLLYIIASCVSSPSEKLISEIARSVRAHQKNWMNRLTLNNEQRKKVEQMRSSTSIQKFEHLIDSHNISIINFLEPSFPSLLKEIPDHPLLLYYRGNLSVLSNQCLAIVGSRKQTTYSSQVINKLLSNIRPNDLTIVSGLAFGVDSSAHQSAINNDLKTVAVLATGIDKGSLYPRSNFQLSERIIQTGGLLISEYPPLTKAMPYQFVARNRIIAGLSKAIAIIEAAGKSGSLITAELANEYNRTVFSVPGSIFGRNSIGTNNLIKSGAELLSSPDDITNYFEIETKNLSEVKYRKFNELELRVLEYIKQPISFDELLDYTSLSHSELQSTLMQLEINKVIFQANPQIFERTS